MSFISVRDIDDLCERVGKMTEMLLRLLATYRIGDRVIVTKYKGLDTVEDQEEREGLAKIIGKAFEIKDISIWETDSQDKPYHVVYELHVGDVTGLHEKDYEESVFMEEDELVKE